MIHLLVPIFTEEYKIDVFLGTKQEAVRMMKRLFKYSKEKSEKDIKYSRGRFFDCLPENNPVIWIDSDEILPSVLATVAHEACHAVYSIADYIGMEDRSGEFHAHGISAVMRAVNKEIGLGTPKYYKRYKKYGAKKRS